MNMSQNSDAFSIVKNQILKQKYECINMCMKQTEKRVKDIKKKNIQLRQMIAHKEQENINFQNIVSLQIEQNLKKYQDQQRDKLHRLEQLKRLIQQYKFLCGESIKYKSVRSQVKYQSNKTETINPHMEQSSRQNSFLNNLNTSQSQNTNNLSFVRNKSYTKIKTKIYCQECEVEYKPNEYYRHMQEYHNQNYASRPQIVTNRTKQNPNGKLSGYNTMRN